MANTTSRDRRVLTDTKSLSLKGLSAGKVGAFGGAIIGVASIAPVYTMTSGLGPTIAVAGLQTPFIVLVAFIPMLFVLMGYRELNRAMPDSGSTFTWSSRAFGPWIGWLGGWGLIAATALVLANLAAVAVDFFFIAVGQIFNNDAIADISGNLWVNIPVTAVLVALAAYISYRGIEETQRVQYVLVGVQVIAIVWFVVAAVIRVANHSAYDYTPVTFEWFNPALLGDSPREVFSAIAAGLSLSIFMFWGWDVVLTMNEEAKDPRRTPGRAALLTIAIILTIYLATIFASLSYAGIGKDGLGAGNPDNQELILAALAPAIMGPAALFVSVAVFFSSVAALQSTLVSPSRTLQAMAHYRAVPASFGKLSKYKTPGTATIVAALSSIAFYIVMRSLSENALWDTITAMGIMVCFYYGITGLAAFWYFRGTWFASARNFFFRFLLPLVGGLTLMVMFVETLIDSIDPSYGSGSAMFATRYVDGVAQDGIGVVFVAGVLILGVGVVLMILQAIRAPGFFRGEQIEVGSVLQEQDMLAFDAETGSPASNSASTPEPASRQLEEQQ